MMPRRALLIAVVARCSALITTRNLRPTPHFLRAAATAVEAAPDVTRSLTVCQTREDLAEAAELLAVCFLRAS